MAKLCTARTDGGDSDTLSTNAVEEANDTEALVEDASHRSLAALHRALETHEHILEQVRATYTTFETQHGHGGVASLSHHVNDNAQKVIRTLATSGMPPGTLRHVNYLLGLKCPWKLTIVDLYGFFGPAITKARLMEQLRPLSRHVPDFATVGAELRTVQRQRQADEIRRAGVRRHEEWQPHDADVVFQRLCPAVTPDAPASEATEAVGDDEGEVEGAEGREEEGASENAPNPLLPCSPFAAADVEAVVSPYDSPRSYPSVERMRHASLDQSIITADRANPLFSPGASPSPTSLSLLYEGANTRFLDDRPRKRQKVSGAGEPLDAGSANNVHNQVQDNPSLLPESISSPPPPPLLRLSIASYDRHHREDRKVIGSPGGNNQVSPSLTAESAQDPAGSKRRVADNIGVRRQPPSQTYSTVRADSRVGAGGQMSSSSNTVTTPCGTAQRVSIHSLLLSSPTTPSPRGAHRLGDALVVDTLADDPQDTQERSHQAYNARADCPRAGAAGSTRARDVQATNPRLHIDGPQRALQSLGPIEWLNGAAVHWILKTFIPDPDRFHLVDYCFVNPQRPTGGLKWKYRPRLKSENILIVPLSHGSHWTVGIIHLLHGIVEVYDPLQDSKYEEASAGALRAFATLLPCKMPLTLQVTKTSLRQRDGFNCGIYISVWTIHRMFDKSTPESIEPLIWRQAFRTAIRAGHALPTEIISMARGEPMLPVLPHATDAQDLLDRYEADVQAVLDTVKAIRRFRTQNERSPDTYKAIADLAEACRPRSAAVQELAQAQEHVDKLRDLVPHLPRLDGSASFQAHTEQYLAQYAQQHADHIFRYPALTAVIDNMRSSETQCRQRLAALRSEEETLTSRLRLHTRTIQAQLTDDEEV